MSFAITPQAECPYCYASYDPTMSKYTISVTKGLPEIHLLTEVCCQSCIGRVCDAVKNCFTALPLQEMSFAESRAEIDLNPPVDWSFLNFDSQERPSNYRGFTDLQLALLGAIPDHSEINVYKEIIEEAAAREPLRLDPNLWAAALDRILPVPADGDPARVAMNNFGERSALFHGDMERFTALMDVIGRYKIALPPEVWGDALLRAGPHCIQITPRKPFPYQREYAPGNAQMVGLLLSTIRQTRATLSSEVFFKSLSYTKDDMHRDVLFTFFTVMPNESIVDFLVQLSMDLQLDPYLMFFVEALGQLLKIKTGSDLDSILLDFFGKYWKSSSRTVAIVEAMLKEGVERSFLERAALSHPLLAQTLRKVPAQSYTHTHCGK